jgi:hypothetical protein
LVFDSSTGTYASGSLYLGGSIGASGTFVVGNGGITLLNGLPKEGVQIGTIENAGAAHTVYLGYDGRYELRNSNGRAVKKVVRLGELVASSLGDTVTPIKIENVSGASTIDLRRTSIGPVIHLTAGRLGTTFHQGVTGIGGGISLGGSGTGTNPNARSFTVPAFASLSRQIKSAGATVQVYSQKLMLVTGDTFSVGKMIGVDEVGSLDLTQSLGFAHDGVSDASIGDAIAAATSGHVGSRRLPARFVNRGSQVVVYGLPDGGTAVVNNLAQPALNATGTVVVMPRAKDVRQSLIDAGINLV